MTELEEKIYANGSTKLSQTLAKGITLINEFVLAILRKERVHAVKNNYITDDNYFIVDEDELSYHTGLSVDVICNVIRNLQRRKVIHGKRVEDFDLVRIDDEKIIELVKDFEIDEPNTFGSWDKDLKKVQKNIHKLDLIRKENNYGAETITNTKNNELKITRTIKKDNSNDKSSLPEHNQ